MKKVTKLIRKCIPLPAIASLSVFVFSAIIYILAVNITVFADFTDTYVSGALRRFLSGTTDFLPFSLFELLLYFVPLALIFAVVFGLKRRGAFAVRYLFSLLAVVSLLFSTYIFSFGIAYRKAPISEQLGISDTAPERDDLVRVFIMVRDEVNLHAELARTDGTHTELPYSFSDLSEKISSAYEALSRDFPMIPGFPSRAKPVLASPVMSAMGITGIYSPFTGEANINMEYPDYTRPFTVAHEFAHQRGIARENEANFIAYLVCTYSEDYYIRYSGYLSLYEYLASALYSLDEELYRELSSSLSDTARQDILASREVSLKYKDNLLGKINNKANELYLKGNGTEGVISYSYVVRLAVAYHVGKN